MVSPANLFLVAVTLGRTVAQLCSTTTVASSYPTDTATPLALQSYSYCGGTLTVQTFIQNLCYDKNVFLYFTNSLGKSTPLSVIQLNYISSVTGSDNTLDWEYWGAATPVYVDGITELLNLTFDAIDIKQVYEQLLDLPVVASGAPIPTTTAPIPYATPRGFGTDITNWLSPVNSSEAGISRSRMFNNIDVPGAAPGTVIAAQSYVSPNYAYNWVRDSSLTMDVVTDLYAFANSSSAKTAYETILFQYASARVTEQNDPGLQTGLGEPKFNLNNTIFTGPWGRPQNDGPATSAITLMKFATAYLLAGGSINTVREQIWDSTTYPTQAPVMRDLQFVATNWSSPSFDIWEEEQGDHFYDRLVQRRALVTGSIFAKALGDETFSGTLSSAATALTATLSQFWDPARNLILYEYGPVLHNKASYKDTAVILGVLHGYADDGVFGPTDDQVLASAYEISTSFLPLYPIANITIDPASNQPLGIPVGRYPEDVYNGISTSGIGNPWYLCTSALAELFYRAAAQFTLEQQITVTTASLPFWQYFAPQHTYTAGTTYRQNAAFFQMLASLQGWGDAFLRRVKYHTPADGHLREEIDRTTGVPVGAQDLTWSYAALLTASFARAVAMGNFAYVAELANL